MCTKAELPHHVCRLGPLMPAGVRGPWFLVDAVRNRALFSPPPWTPEMIPRQRLQTHRALLSERSLLESWRSVS